MRFAFTIKRVACPTGIFFKIDLLKSAEYLLALLLFRRISGASAYAPTSFIAQGIYWWQEVRLVRMNRKLTKV